MLLPLPANADGRHMAGTRISLSATAQRELPNDELLVNFWIEKEGADAVEVRRYVNRVSRVVQQRLQREKGLVVKTISRNLQPVWKSPKSSQRIRSGWRMSQAGKVRTTHLERVSEWLDAIETAGAHLSGLNFRISEQASKKAMNALRLEAIAAFRARAKVIAQGLDATAFRIIRLNTNGTAPRPVAYRGEMAMMAKSTADAPILSAGEGKLKVTISGEIEVPFTDFPVREGSSE